VEESFEQKCLENKEEMVVVVEERKASAVCLVFIGILDSRAQIGFKFYVGQFLCKIFRGGELDENAPKEVQNYLEFTGS
jgi:hypothetical protein